MSQLSKTEIILLKKARKNCLKNIESIVWGAKTEYPEFEGIRKANDLMSFVWRISEIIEKSEESAAP